MTQTFSLTDPTVTIPLTDGGGHAAPDGFNVMELPGIVPAGKPNTVLSFPVIVTVQVKVAVWVLPVPVSFLLWSKLHTSAPSNMLFIVTLPGVDVLFAGLFAGLFDVEDGCGLWDVVALVVEPCCVVVLSYYLLSLVCLLTVVAPIAEVVLVLVLVGFFCACIFLDALLKV